MIQATPTEPKAEARLNTIWMRKACGLVKPLATIRLGIQFSSRCNINAEQMNATHNNNVCRTRARSNRVENTPRFALALERAAWNRVDSGSSAAMMGANTNG